MKTTFKSFHKGDGLSIFDIDETLLRTFAKVLVRDKMSGKIVQKLSNTEYNSHELQPGHEYDYTQFGDAKLFRSTSKPIRELLERIKYVIRVIDDAGARDSKVILLTARGKFDDHDEFMDTFKDHGINTGKIDVITAGSASAKKKHIDDLLSTGKFTRVRMYDDHTPNLNDFLALKDKYSNVHFRAYVVKNGKMEIYKEI